MFLERLSIFGALERFWSGGVLECWSVFGAFLERWSIFGALEHLERNERAKLTTPKEPSYLAGNTSMSTDQVCNVQPVHRHAECFHYTLPIPSGLASRV